MKGESDFVYLPDITIKNADPSRYTSLLLPGCMNIKTLYNNEDIIEFIRKCAENPELKIASISSSPYLLAKAGLLPQQNVHDRHGFGNKETNGVV
nr:DJ-1/PfpI family protein [Paenibacillus taihuensis]